MLSLSGPIAEHDTLSVDLPGFHLNASQDTGGGEEAVEASLVGKPMQHGDGSAAAAEAFVSSELGRTGGVAELYDALHALVSFEVSFVSVGTHRMRDFRKYQNLILSCTYLRILFTLIGCYVS